MISGGENKGGMTSTELLGRVHAKLAEVERIQKSHSYDEHIVRAQELRATLEALELSITSESLTPRKATGEFVKCIESGSFMEPTR
jgi:hypothetical protein